jgi:hypothetical protein
LHLSEKSYILHLSAAPNSTDFATAIFKSTIRSLLQSNHKLQLKDSWAMVQLELGYQSTTF